MFEAPTDYVHCECCAEVYPVFNATTDGPFGVVSLGDEGECDNPLCTGLPPTCPHCFSQSIYFDPSTGCPHCTECDSNAFDASNEWEYETPARVKERRLGRLLDSLAGCVSEMSIASVTGEPDALHWDKFSLLVDALSSNSVKKPVRKGLFYV